MQNPQKIDTKDNRIKMTSGYAALKLTNNIQIIRQVKKICLFFGAFMCNTVCVSLFDCNVM